MNNRPLDIVIPTFNREALICRAVDAALAQYYPEVRVYVVDDGSTDNTAEALRQYFERPNFCYLRVSKNLGTANAKNVGLLLTSGEAITFHDSDDVAYPEKLLVQERSLSSLGAHRSDFFDWSHLPNTEAGNFDLALSAYRLLKNDGREFLIDSPLSIFDDFFPNVQARCPVEGDWILINCGLFNRKVFEQIGGFADHIEEDRDLRNRCLAAGFLINFIEQPLLDKIEVEASLTFDPESGYQGQDREAARSCVFQNIQKYRSGSWGADAANSSSVRIDLPGVTILNCSRPELLASSSVIPSTPETSSLFQSVCTFKKEGA